MWGTVISLSHGLFTVLRRSHHNSLAIISPPAPPARLHSTAPLTWVRITRSGHQSMKIDQYMLVNNRNIVESLTRIGLNFEAGKWNSWCLNVHLSSHPDMLVSGSRSPFCHSLKNYSMLNWRIKYNSFFMLLISFSKSNSYSLKNMLNAISSCISFFQSLSFCQRNK